MRTGLCDFGQLSRRHGNFVHLLCLSFDASFQFVTEYWLLKLTHFHYCHYYHHTAEIQWEITGMREEKAVAMWPHGNATMLQKW